MTPHPELIRLLAQLMRDVAQGGPEPVREASQRLIYLGWLVRGMKRVESANDSIFPDDLG